MLKSSGRRYSSSSESQAECDVVGEEDEDEGEKGWASSRSRRCSSDPILSFGTRCDRWKYERRLQYFET